MRHLHIIALLVLSACSVFVPLSPEERANLESRTYPISKAIVFEGVREVLKMYPMGIQEANLETGTVNSNIGGPQAGPMGTMVGYQVKVTVEEPVPGQARVTPTWWMNVSSDPIRPSLILQPVPSKPALYRDFFEVLTAKLDKKP